MRRKWFSSLQSKYMLIIIVALGIIQATYLMAALAFTGLAQRMEEEDIPEFDIVEQEWHKDAAAIRSHGEQAAAVQVEALFAAWSEHYAEATMFWVNSSGQLTRDWNMSESSVLPEQWSPSYTVSFMKQSYGNDPYTVVAFVGEGQEQGFVVIQLPRSIFQSVYQSMYDKFGNFVLIAMFMFVVIFIIISYLFFRKIRKRLLSLQKAMHIRDDSGLPLPIQISKRDEIGELELAFNTMVNELGRSREREQDEEKIRRELIANISHDIRTPLTKVRANAYTLRKLQLPNDAEHALIAMDSSIQHIDELVDNLLAYTLLVSEQYRYEPQRLGIHRFLREHIAAWYDVFEQEGFEVEMKLEQLHHASWHVDHIWMKRILDNVLQNVHRHASAGKYVAIETRSCNRYDVIAVVDRGKGLCENTTQQGAGIGLSIVTMMTEGMGLSWHSYKREEEFVVEIRHPHQSETAAVK